MAMSMHLVQSNVSSVSSPYEESSSSTSAIRELLFTCAKCLHTYNTRDFLIRHIFSHSLLINIPKYICNYCGQVFFAESTLYSHRVDHNSETAMKQQPLFQRACASCAQIFLSWNSLTRHVFQHVTDISCPLYFCMHCFKVFQDLTKLRLHQYSCRCTQLPLILQQTRCHTIPIDDHQQPYTSEICRKFIMETSPLIMHEIMHLHKQSVTCEVCGKIFVHEGQRPYLCEICGKLFTQSSSVKRHKRVHRDERSYVCEVCRKSFKRSFNLAVHKKVHTGERPYACEVCGKPFTRYSNLLRHKIIHTGERPYVCENCGKPFTQSGDLVKHKRIHTGEQPYACEVCGKLFAMSSNLITHKRIHTGERPYTCEVCQKSFSQSNSLVRHKRIHSCQ